MFWLLLACTSTPPNQALSDGVWRLEGQGFSGVLRVADDLCRIGLWGPTLRAGSEEVPCQSVREEERIGLHFEIEIGPGNAAAYGWLDPALSLFTLPLGSREGDFERTMNLEPGVPDAAALKQAQVRSETGLAASRAMWERSVFRLEDAGELVGELYLPSDQAPQIQLYSARWMTPGRVAAELAEKGPDLWLSFEIMPSLQSEPGLVLINRTENRLVFPLGERPLPGEMRLELVDGIVRPEEREVAVEKALQDSLKRERLVTGSLVDALWGSALEQACPSSETLLVANPELSLGLQGYAVSTELEEDACRLLVEPRPIQQGRRLAFRVGEQSEMEVVERLFSLD